MQPNYNNMLFQTYNISHYAVAPRQTVNSIFSKPKKQKTIQRQIQNPVKDLDEDHFQNI